jgi:hypothetical protein
MLPARHFARNRRGCFLRRGISAALVAAYVVVVAGIPLPAMNRPANSGERFPCESCGCGCDSAEHCWRNCCCHTLAERLAWAEKNGVQPPDFALQAAALAGLDAGGRPPSQKVVKVAMSFKTESAAPSCCHAKATCCKSATNQHSCCSSHSEPQAKAAAANFIIAWRALGCRGQSLNWLAAVPTLISLTPEFSDQLALVAWLGPHSSEVAAGVALVPTPPPPERA